MKQEFLYEYTLEGDQSDCEYKTRADALKGAELAWQEMCDNSMDYGENYVSVSKISVDTGRAISVKHFIINSEYESNEAPYLQSEFI